MLTRRFRAVLVAGAAFVAAAAPLPAAAGAATTAPAPDCGQPAGPPADALTALPAPRVIGLSGSVPIVTMQPFAEFLIAMGYPEARIKHPGDERWSHSPYEPSERVAGMIAWFYEHEGVRPMMVGHSQGGMQAIKVLHDLAGTFAPSLPVWNPIAEQPEPRTSITDPITGRDLPVVGNKVSYTSAVGAGGPSGVLPNQWSVITRIREIPDTTVQFDGFFIGIDWFAMTFTEAGVPRFTSASGNVKVRNIVLPAGYLHVTVPATHHLPGNLSGGEHGWLLRQYAPRTDAAGDLREIGAWQFDGPVRFGETSVEFDPGFPAWARGSDNWSDVDVAATLRIDATAVAAHLATLKEFPIRQKGGTLTPRPVK